MSHPQGVALFLAGWLRGSPREGLPEGLRRVEGKGAVMSPSPFRSPDRCSRRGEPRAVGAHAGQAQLQRLRKCTMKARKRSETLLIVEPALLNPLSQEQGALS